MRYTILELVWSRIFFTETPKGRAVIYLWQQIKCRDPFAESLGPVTQQGEPLSHLTLRRRGAACLLWPPLGAAAQMSHVKPIEIGIGLTGVSTHAKVANVSAENPTKDMGVSCKCK